MSVTERLSGAIPAVRNRFWYSLLSGVEAAPHLGHALRRDEKVTGHRMNFVVETIADSYRAVHQQLRDMLASLNPAALTWTPGPQTNPISVLIIHTLGSEEEVWRLVAKAPVDRDRDAEFVPQSVTIADLLSRLAAADQLLATLAPQATAATLEGQAERSGRSPQTGLHWLVTNYGHAREHLAHIELTLQLYRAT